MFLPVYYLILVSCVTSAVQVMRCCPFGLDLDRDLRCVPSTFTQPAIYSPEDGDYLKVVPTWFEVLENARPKCKKTRYIQSSRTNPYFMFDTGLVITELGSGVSLESNEYCFGENAILACDQEDEVEGGHRVRKCCGDNAIYDQNSCVGTTDDMSLDSLLGNFTLISGFPVCKLQLDEITIIGDTESAQLQSDASLIIAGKIVPREEFCIERIRIRGEDGKAKVFACAEHALPSGSSAEIVQADIRFTLYPAGLIISAIFLAATLGTGWLLPASHHQLHWRCQTYHVGCLMLGDICMAIIQLSGDSLRGEFCRVFAILAHFFFLATFFWLNTMCFNIWWTFRDLRPTSLEKGQELKRLRFYAAYAWGGPLVVAGLAAILDHLAETTESSHILRPHFGEKQCWFIGNMEIFVYFFGPIGILLAINLIFFAATARELTCGLWKGELVKSSTERSRALPRTNENESARDRSNRRAALGKVCLKLVIVMGVPWIFDVISWWVGGPNFLWYVTDLLNALQGVFIFIVVGCQPQVRAALKRLWLRNPRAGANRTGNGLSTTSNGLSGMGDSLTNNPSTKTANLETIC